MIISKFVSCEPTSEKLCIFDQEKELEQLSPFSCSAGDVFFDDPTKIPLWSILSLKSLFFERVFSKVSLLKVGRSMLGPDFFTSSLSFTSLTIFSNTSCIGYPKISAAAGWSNFFGRGSPKLSSSPTPPLSPASPSIFSVENKEFRN